MAQLAARKQVAKGMFMCSELYIAAMEGRMQEVTRLLTGTRDGAIEAARNGQAFQATRGNGNPFLVC